MIKRLMIVIIGLLLAPSMVFANGLLDNVVGYYELEETGLNYADETGSYDITSSQGGIPSRVSGILNFGQEFQKSSTDDLIVPHDMLYDNINADGNFTISAWIKGTNGNTNQIFGAFAGDTSNTNGGVNFFVETGKVMVGGNDCNSGGSWYNTKIGIDVDDGNWHHVMVVYTNYNSQEVWIDGSYAGSSSNPYCVPSSGQYDAGSSAINQKFGSNPSSGGHSAQWSDYTMDEVGFWNAPLNQTHATALYNNGSALAYSNFTAGPYDVTNINNYASRYYKMEDTSGNIVDETGNQNGVATGISYGETGIIDNAIGFDGTSGDKVVVGGYPTNANGVWSSCTWVYVTGSKAWENVWRADQTGVYRNVALQRTGDASGTYSDTWRYVFSSGFDAVGGSVNYNQWDHICTSNDGSTAKLYQNGVQVASSSVSAQAVTWNYDLTLGIRPDTNGEKYTGYLDEIAMFNGYTLTQADINFLYASGAPDSNQQYTFSTSPANTNPTITSVVDQVMFEDTTLDVPGAFTIGDAEDPISALTLSYTSSNTTILNSTSAITFVTDSLTGITDMNSITPNANAFGNVNVTIVVTDTGALTNSTTFQLNVNPVNDAPVIIGTIPDVTTTLGATNMINFSVSDIDDAYTDLSYQLLNQSISISSDFSETDGASQHVNITAPSSFGEGLYQIKVSDDDGAYAVSNIASYRVECDSSVLAIPISSTDDVPCFYQDFTANKDTDIYVWEWDDFANSVESVSIQVYKTTGNVRTLLDDQTSTANAGNFTFDFSATNPSDSLLFFLTMTDTNRNWTYTTIPADSRQYQEEVDQSLNLASQFKNSDGVIYATLILFLMLTIGVASQSATLTMVFGMLGLFIANFFVFEIPSTILTIVMVVVFVLLMFIAKLRVD